MKSIRGVAKGEAVGVGRPPTGTFFVGKTGMINATFLDVVLSELLRADKSNVYTFNIFFKVKTNTIIR